MNRTLFRRLLPLAIVFVVLVLIMPKTAKFNYDYRKGRPWKYETLFAQFDFPIYKTAEQIRAERASSSSEVIPYYKYSDDVTNRTLRSVESLELGNVRNAVVNSLRGIYQKGVMADETGRRSDSYLSSEIIYVQKSKHVSKQPSSEVYRISEARAKLVADVSPQTRRNVDSLFRKTGVYDLIVPNLLYDAQTTDLVHSESDRSISPTSGYVNAGQLIVSNGEVVTAEVAQMLDSYKREYEENLGYSAPTLLYWLGCILIALAFVTIIYLAVWYTNRGLFGDTRWLYVLCVFTLAAVVTLVIIRTNENLLYFVPFTLFGLYLQAFMRRRVIVPVYIISLLPLLVFAHDGPVLFVMFLVAGMVAIFFFATFQRGWQQFITALITFVVLALVFLGFRACDLIVGDVWSTLLRLLIGSLLTVAGYPLVYIFEKIFNLVSNSRLAELCDTSNPLVRELEQKAPGTFQHALQVMNMAESVARAIDENVDLVRAGALYHDIGKMNNPLCFIENESLVQKGADEHKYHDGLSPLQSAQDIIRHVSDGVEIAQKHHLPSVVVDFIRTHHGTSAAGYFLSKYRSEGGDPAQEGEFHYPGPAAATKAQIILMLCDSVEAASRTLTDYSPASCSAFVEKIVSGKMADGQFDNADVTVRELGIIKETIKNYIAQTHHGRIAYPERIKSRKNR